MKICNIRKSVHTSIAVVVLFGLAACGGGGGDGGGGGTETASGVFKDSNVSGLNYESGSQAGSTGADGSFTYEVGQATTFSAGGVTIGSTTGQSVVTPIDLVPGGSSSTLQVQNIVRFLLMLDTDGDSTNGISISPAVQTIADTWAQVDFTAADMATELASIISDAASVDGTAHALPDIATAQSHLESTLLCVRAGAYRGTFTGSDNGPFGVLIDATTGFLSGFAFANLDQELLSLSGITAISFDQNAAFISGEASSGATFSGQFTGPDQIGGTWELLPETGTFSGSRIGGAANAALRFTGSFIGDAFGLFVFDVDTSDNVTGVAYTVLALADGTTDELIAFSGTLSGTNLTATIADNTATLTGTLDKNAGTLSGTWNDADGNTGTFSGSGCKLN